MLFQYMKLAQQLMSDVKQELLNPSFLISFINTARGQLAGEAECIRVFGGLFTAIGTQSYAYTGITTAVGVQGVMNVRRINYLSGAGQKFVSPLPWEWFDLYYMNNTGPVMAPPTVWAQYAQGSSGSFFLYPIPDAIYTLRLDCVCYPSDLTTDTDTEVIPYPWTDAIPYFAAYFAYLNVQNMEKANAMLERYREFVMRARRFTTPGILPAQYEQVSAPASPVVQQQMPHQRPS